MVSQEFMDPASEGHHIKFNQNKGGKWLWI